MQKPLLEGLLLIIFSKLVAYYCFLIELFQIIFMHLRYAHVHNYLLTKRRGYLQRSTV